MMLREIFLISLIAVAISTIIYVFVNDHMIGYMRHIFDEAKLFLVTFFLYFLFVTITTLTYPAFIILRKIPNMKME